LRKHISDLRQTRTPPVDSTDSPTAILTRIRETEDGDAALVSLLRDFQPHLSRYLTASPAPFTLPAIVLSAQTRHRLETVKFHYEQFKDQSLATLPSFNAIIRLVPLLIRDSLERNDRTDAVDRASECVAAFVEVVTLGLALSSGSSGKCRYTRPSFRIHWRDPDDGIFDGELISNFEKAHLAKQFRDAGAIDENKVILDSIHAITGTFVLAPDMVSFICLPILKHIILVTSSQTIPDTFLRVFFDQVVPEGTTVQLLVRIIFIAPPTITLACTGLIPLQRCSPISENQPYELMLLYYRFICLIASTPPSDRLAALKSVTSTVEWSSKTNPQATVANIITGHLTQFSMILDQLRDTSVQFSDERAGSEA